MDEAHKAIEQTENWLDDARMSLRMIRRGKHPYNKARLHDVVLDLRELADRLEPHIEALKD